MSIFDYSRASVDALSNFVKFPEFDWEKDTDALLQRKLDPARVPLFLHEATHHWCFDSPVFYALFILQVRALGGVWQIANKRQIDEFDVIDDNYRYRAVVDLYRPILEGLALFAEYVALPRGQFIYSHPFSQMQVLCAGWFDEKENTRKATNRLLAAARGSAEFLRKKAGLLSMPFEASRSPYLTGYMLVCSIWRAMLGHRIDLFAGNTDAFLSYLRSYFFFDYELIAILMNNQLHETAIVQTIGQHLIRRIIRLVNSDLSILDALKHADEKSILEDILQRYSVGTLKSAVSDWDTNDLVAINPHRIVMRTKGNWFRKIGISGLDGAFKPVKGVLNDDAKAAETQKQLLSAFNWLLPNTNEGDDHLAAIKQVAFAQLFERTKLVMLQIPTQATIGDGRCAMTLRTGKLTMDAAKGAQPGVYNARLDLAVSSRVVNPLAYIWADGRLIGMSLPPQYGSKLDVNDVTTMRDGATFRELVEILKEVTKTDKSVADSYVGIFTDSYEEAIVKSIDRVYDTVFMGLFANTDWSAAHDRMREHGLLGLESASFAAVRGIACLSQLSCFPISEGGWNKFVSSIRADGDLPDPVDEAMRLFGPESKMPLMLRTDTHWLWI
jgi:hypothetical protein